MSERSERTTAGRANSREGGTSPWYLGNVPGSREAASEPTGDGAWGRSPLEDSA